VIGLGPPPSPAGTPVHTFPGAAWARRDMQCGPEDATRADLDSWVGFSLAQEQESLWPQLTSPHLTGRKTISGLPSQIEGFGYDMRGQLAGHMLLSSESYIRASGPKRNGRRLGNAVVHHHRLAGLIVVGDMLVWHELA
jgi:hypothetical protein